MSTLRPYTESDPSSEEARLVRLVRPPPPMSALQAARAKERIAELSRAPRVTARPWGAATAIGAAVVFTLLGATMIAQRTSDANVGSTPAELQASSSTTTNDVAAQSSDEIVPAVSVTSLPSVEPPTRTTNRQPVPRTAHNTARPQGDRAEGPEQEDALSKELRLVDGARLELRARPEHAHELLVRHASEFPSGQLASEREVLLVDALLRLDRRQEAEAHARALTAREPGSPYAQRVTALLSSSASKPEGK